MAEFYFYAYTIGARFGGHGVQCKNLADARRVAAGFAPDCIQARVSVSVGIGRGRDFRIETLLVERYTPGGFVPAEAGEV